MLTQIDKIACTLCCTKWEENEEFYFKHPRFGTCHARCAEAVTDAENLLPPKTGEGE